MTRELFSCTSSHSAFGSIKRGVTVSVSGGEPLTRSTVTRVGLPARSFSERTGW